MNCIPLFKTPFYKTGLTCILFCIGVIAFGQMPPVPINTSSAGPDDQPPEICTFAPSNQTSKSLTFTLKNNFNRDIALVNLDESAFSTYDLESNSIVSVVIRADGETSEGWPIWKPGFHSVTVHFVNDINSVNDDHCFDLGLDFWYRNLGDRQFGNYVAGGTFKATVFPGKPKMSSFFIQKTDKADSHLARIDVDKTPLTSIRSAGSSLILDVQDEENPISIYIAGVTNPSYQHVITNSEFYPSGKHLINLQDLEPGLYQVIVKQGSQIKHMKHMHIQE